MRLLLDSFWRAAAYCLHPRVIALSLLPLLVMVLLALGLGYFFWVPAVDAVRDFLASYEIVGSFMAWLDKMGFASLKLVLAPMLVVFVITPLIVVLALMAVAILMTPSMLNLVRDRRFPDLERKRGGSTLGSIFVSGWAVLVALLVMVVSIPFWLIPPLVLILPPLIWGWLTYKVMVYDVLSEHASKDERRQLIRQHKGPLLGMGVITGYLGAAPSLVWASGAMFIAMAPVLVPLAIWIYTLVFAFSALWFSHYALSALQAMRVAKAVADRAAQAEPADAPKNTLELLPPLPAGSDRPVLLPLPPI
ncbi:MAG: EI24 domain-containing protein [Pseudorhodobacter sp.]|nr:EI24 domain-containing protein [Rhizobacter sp.]